MHDGLFCAFDELGMGAATETYTKIKNTARQEQDAFAAMSHGRRPLPRRRPRPAPRRPGACRRGLHRLLN